MARPLGKIQIRMICPNCGTTRVRRYKKKRLQKITRIHCRDCGRFAPWYRWSFDNPAELNVA